jgi:Lrp/AsnC family transcriptional regulator
MQPANAIATGAHEQERQQRVDQAGDPGGDHLPTETSGGAQMRQVGLPGGGRMLGEGIGARSVHDSQPSEIGRRHDCEIMDSSPAERNNVAPVACPAHFGPPLMDRLDRRILDLLQHDGSLTAADIAERVGLSKAPCWRRIQRLQETGVITRTVALVDAKAINLGTTVFVTVKTSNHSAAWFEQFVRTVRDIPEVTEIHRVSGEVDYLLRVVVPNIDAYDVVYKRLIAGCAFLDVSASFSLETIKYTTALPLTYASVDD